jgi:hypothetical protein
MNTGFWAYQMRTEDLPLGTACCGFLQFVAASVMRAAQYCTEIGNRKVHHSRRR